MSGSLERWQAVLGMNARNHHIDRVNDRAAIDLVNDKVATKRVLAAAGLPVPATIAVLESPRDLASLGVDALPEAWALKPVHGRGGSGILLARSRVGEGWWSVGGRRLPLRDVVDHVRLILQGEYSPAGRQRDAALVEPLLEPDDELAAVVPAGLPDVRVICHSGAPVAAMLRLPTVASGGRANLHQGGIGAAVDLATGRVVAARWLRRPCTVHPDTGAALIGLRVPAWAQVLETAAACADVTGLGYLGADIVFDRTVGHLVLEVNARPGLEIQNVRSRGLRPELLDAASDGAVPAPRRIRRPASLAGILPATR